MRRKGWPGLTVSKAPVHPMVLSLSSIGSGPVVRENLNGNRMADPSLPSMGGQGFRERETEEREGEGEEGLGRHIPSDLLPPTSNT